MGLISGLLGNVSEVDTARVDRLVDSVLAPEERVERAYQLIRDLFIFTTRRLIIIDKQGVTGKKAEFMSIPYSKITRFSMETAGTFDIDSELKIWVGSDPTPVIADFRRNAAVKEAYATLSRYVLE